MYNFEKNKKKNLKFLNFLPGSLKYVLAMKNV